MKLTKIIIAGLICLLIGVVIFFVGFALADFDITKISTESKIQMKNFDSVNDVKEIIVEEKNLLFEIRKSTDDSVHFTYYENDKEYYDINQSDDGVLSIVKKDTRKWYDYIFNINFQTNEPVIYIPKNYSGDLSVEDSNSSIDISDVTAMNVSLTTSNGKIVADKVMTSGKFDVSTSNGSIIISKMKASGDFISRTSNGKIDLEDVEAANFDLKTSNANVILNSIISQNDIALVTSNGQIDLENIDFSNGFKCRSSNGSISGEIKGNVSDYSIKSKTSNGNNNLPENSSGGDKSIDIETSNSSIEVNFID